MPSIDTRDDDRDSVFLLTELSREHARMSASVKVRNLSAGGMMVEGDVRFERGERVIAALRNIGSIAGTVVWVHGRRLGIAFDEPVDPKDARMTVRGGNAEAPGYARAALAAPRHDGWNGRLRRL
jgi:hypothetical protein